MQWCNVSYILANVLAGPHLLPHPLTDNDYRDFISHDRPKLLEDVPLGVRARMWYMHDGAPAHFSRAVRDVLNNTYRYRRIGRGGPTAWPPRSPDLNRLDFYLWEHLKSLLYSASFDNEEALQHRIVDACETIHNYPGIFERMRRSMMRHVEAYIESQGGQFQNLLQMYSFSCFRTHVDLPFFLLFVHGILAQSLFTSLSYTLHIMDIRGWFQANVSLS
jgi:hypothetical protein